MVLILAACGGEPAPHPTPVASIITPVAPTPDIPVLLTGAEDRLVLPTLTPAAEPAGVARAGGAQPTAVPATPGYGRPTPALSFSSISGGGSGVVPSADNTGSDPVVDVTLTQDEIDSAMVLRRPGCGEDFRARLINYAGPESFGAEVATRLSEEMLEGRPDCVEQGWTPVFSNLAVCRRVKVTGAADSGVPTTFTVSSLRQVRLGPSIRETAYGRILLHFAKLPFRDEGGCWYYRADNRNWYWNVRGQLAGSSRFQDIDSGRDEPVFEQCDSLLEILVPKLIAAGAELDSLLVANAIDRIRLQVHEHCAATGPYGNYLWSTYPRALPQNGCPVSVPTGALGEDRYVIHWADGHFDARGRPCWVLEPVEGEDDGEEAPSGEDTASSGGTAPGEEAPGEGDAGGTSEEDES